MGAFSTKNNAASTHSTPSKDQGEKSFFGVQAKLTIGKSNDKYETQADALADKVVSKKETKTNQTFFSPAAVLQRKQNNEIQKNENSENEIQEKPLAESITPVVQLQPAKEETVQQKEQSDAPKTNAGTEQKLSSSKGNGSPLPENTKTEMESGFGTDFSNVRIHNDSNAVQMNKELGAQAFANGNDIYFNEGKFSPESQDGKHLLAHELTHTVQQGASKPVIQKKEEEPNSSGEKTDTAQESKTSEPDPANQTSAEQPRLPDGSGANSENTGNNQNTSVTDNGSDNNQPGAQVKQNQPTAVSNPQSVPEAAPETSSQHDGTSTVNQSTSTESNESSTGESTSNATSASENTSSSSGGSEAKGGFANYDLFLAYVEEKKQASVQYFKNKKQELTDGINEEKRKNKETVQNEIDRLKETKRATLEKINKSYEQTTSAISEKRDSEIQNANDIADAEIARVDEVILTKTGLITSIAEDKAQNVISTGNEQSTQALNTTSGNIKKIDAIIQQKQSQYAGKDNAGDIVQAAWSSKPNAVQKIQESGNLISSEVVSHSLKLADNYRTEATNVSSEFGNKKREAKDAITQRRDEIIKAVTNAAKESLTNLDKETTNLKNELETSTTAQIGTLEKIPEKIDTEFDDVLKTSLAKLDENEATTLQEIDKFKNDIGEIYWYNEEVAAAQGDLGRAIDDHYKDVDKYVTEVIKKVSGVSTEFKTNFISSLNSINSALSETAGGYQESAEKLKSDTVKTIDENARQAETEIKDVADGLDAGLQEQINKSETKWNSQLTDDVSNMRETVNKGLLQQTEILNQFNANLDREFNRSSSWWDKFTDFISGMAKGFVEGFTSLWDALVSAMGTFLFWFIIAIVVIIIVILVIKFGIALAVILKVLLVIGIIIGVLFAIYYIYKAFATEGLSPYERGRLFGRGLFEIFFALIGVGVYSRLAGWIARIARISAIVARVGGLVKFLRIIVLVEDVKAFIALIDSMANIERLLLLMEKIKDVKALIKLLTGANNTARIIEALLAVEKADELLQILTKADDIGRVLTLIEKGIQMGHVESLITVMGKAKELAKLITVLERAGDDIGKAIEVLSAAPDIDKMIIAMERVGAANLGRLITLIQAVDDVNALLRIVTKAADFATLLRIIEEAADVNKIVALFDKVAELDKLVIAFDSFGDTNRLLAVFNGVNDFDKLVSVLAESSALDRLVPFLEGLTDINAAIPKLKALGGELDDFVRFLDEPGMTVGKLEKILHMDNLTVAKLRTLLTHAGGVVDDLIRVLDEIKDLDKLLNYISHFGNFPDVLELVDKAISCGLSRATSGSTIILEFFEDCVAIGYKSKTHLLEFFDMVHASGAPGTKWSEALQYGRNFAAESINAPKANPRAVAGTGQVGSKNFLLADGTSIRVTIENADIAHVANGHTWKYFLMTKGNASSPIVSMFNTGTDVAHLENLARNILNSTEIENLIKTLTRTDMHKGAMALGHQAWVNLNSIDGLIAFYPQGAQGMQIEKKIMKGAVLLWQSL